jgi:hypothetical protein
MEYFFLMVILKFLARLFHELLATIRDMAILLSEL